MLPPHTTYASYVVAGPEIALESDRAVRDLCELDTGELVMVHDVGNASSQVFAQRYTSEGEKSGSAITTGTMLGYTPRVDCDTNGGFAVVWTHADGIAVQRFDSTGGVVGSQILAFANTSETAILPDISIASDSSFVVAWKTTAFSPIYARMFDPAGVPLAPVFQLAGSGNDGPNVERASDDGFLIAPGAIYDAGGTAISSGVGSNACYTPGGNILSINDSMVGSVLAPDGTPIMTNIPLGQTTLGYPAIACGPDGTALVAWATVFGKDGHSGGVRARFFDSAFAPLSDEFAVNSTRGLNQLLPRAATTSDGASLIVWNGSIGDPYPLARDWRSFGKRYCDDAEPGCAYSCPDFDDNIDADSDGVPAGCDRCENAGGTIVSKAKVSARTHPTQWVLDRFNKLLAKGDLLLPPHLTDLAGVAPTVVPMRIAIDSAEGDIVDVTLGTAAYAGKGTAGWRVSAFGTTYKYLDKRSCTDVGADSAINKVVVKDLTAKSTGLVKFTIKGKGRNCAEQFVTYPNTELDSALHVTLAFGGQSGGDAGDCAEVAFDPGECDFKPAPFNRTGCKR